MRTRSLATSLWRETPIALEERNTFGSKPTVNRPMSTVVNVLMLTTLHFRSGRSCAHTNGAGVVAGLVGLGVLEEQPAKSNTTSASVPPLCTIRRILLARIGFVYFERLLR